MNSEKLLKQIQAIAEEHKEEGYEMHHWLGYSSQLLGDFDKAKEHYTQALGLKPDYAFSQLALAQIEMMQSNFQTGREKYELRFEARNNPDDADWREIPVPRWRGENLSGKHIYIWAEQGVGDVVMFAGFLPHLLAQGANITLGVPDKMISLLARSFPNIKVESLNNALDYAAAPMMRNVFKMLEGVAKDLLAPLQSSHSNAQKTFDYAAPMGDLMVYCLPGYIPAKHPPYLAARPASLPGSGRKIGISWHTSNDKDGIIRNIPLKLWAEILAMPDCEFFSLQHHVPEADKKAGINFTIDPVQDINALAALISGMDEVITIDNSNAHLAGALGIPATLLLPRGHNFRWPEANGNKTLWYKSVLLERQQTTGDWESVIKNTARKLSARMAKN